MTVDSVSQVVPLLRPLLYDKPMNASVPVPSLDELRRAIDGVDDALLALLRQRFALSSGVKAVKSADSASLPSPLRPAREAQILKRLLAAASPELNPELLVRLWRSILVESSLVQSPVTIHVGRKLATNMALRLLIRDHFGRFTVSECRDETQALVQINVSPADICIVEPQSPWIDAYLEGKAGKAQVIATLPALQSGGAPALMVFGVAPAQATGDDETLVITKGNLPRDFAAQPLWQLKTGNFKLSGLAGYYSEHESPLIGLVRSNPGLGLKLAGRYPSAIEV